MDGCVVTDLRWERKGGGSWIDLWKAAGCRGVRSCYVAVNTIASLCHRNHQIPCTSLGFDQPPFYLAPPPRPHVTINPITQSQPGPTRNEASLEALQQVGKKLRLDPSSADATAGAAAGAAAAGDAAATAAATADKAGEGAAGKTALKGLAAGAAAAAAAATAQRGKETYWARGTGYGHGASASKVRAWFWIHAWSHTD
jgi:hypothetical protein